MSFGKPFRVHIVRYGGIVASVVLIACCLISLTMRRSAAQDNSAAADGTPKEVQALLTDLADIDTMHALSPLKLHADQAGDLADMITSARKTYETKVNALGSAPLIKMADEIHTVRKNAIAGEPVPKDFDDRVKEIETAFTKKRDQVNTANIISIATASKKILNAAQVATAAKLERRVLEDAGKLAQGTTDDELFNAFVVDVFIQNPRSVVLLQEMKAPAK